MAQMVIPAIMLAGTAMSAYGSIQQGRAQNQAAKYEAQQMETNATATDAAGQHAALEKRRQQEILISRAQATAGASGFGAVDPDVLKVIGGITEEGERGFQTERYNAYSQSMAQRNQAVATRFEGKEAKRASRIQAGATVLSGIADAATVGFSKFGQTPSTGTEGVKQGSKSSTGFNIFGN